MRILIVSNAFPPYDVGGAELIAAQQAKIFQEMGHSVHIFAGKQVRPLNKRALKILALSDVGAIWRGGWHRVRQYLKAKRPDSIDVTWVNILPNQIKSEYINFDNMQALQEFQRCLDGFLPDIVHFHNLSGLSVKMADVCQERGIPTVMTIHDYWGICLKNTMMKDDGMVCKRNTDCIVCRQAILSNNGRDPISPYDRNSYIQKSLLRVTQLISPSRYLSRVYSENGISDNRIRVLANGVDIERFSKVKRQPHKTICFGFLGYLGQHKGVEFLIRAFAMVKGEANLLIFGEGAEQHRYSRLCRELRIKNSVQFTGRVPHQEIESAYQKIDVLILPSIWPENQPVSITEAMACGLPVIASDIGGIPEIVKDSVTGYLVPPRDVKALACRMEEFVSSPEKVDEMGQRGLGISKGFDIKAQTVRVLDIYATLNKLDKPICR